MMIIPGFRRNKTVGVHVYAVSFPYWWSLSIFSEYNDPTMCASRVEQGRVCNYLLFLLLNCSKIASENLKEFRIVYIGHLIRIQGRACLKWNSVGKLRAAGLAAIRDMPLSLAAKPNITQVLDTRSWA
jgi:hypothetical protein